MIGQKRLSGAASRLMVFFCVELAAEILELWPCDLNRPGYIILP